MPAEQPHPYFINYGGGGGGGGGGQAYDFGKNDFELGIGG